MITIYCMAQIFCQIFESKRKYLKGLLRVINIASISLQQSRNTDSFPCQITLHKCNRLNENYSRQEFSEFSESSPNFRKSHTHTHFQIAVCNMKNAPQTLIPTKILIQRANLGKFIDASWKILASIKIIINICAFVTIFSKTKYIAQYFRMLKKYFKREICRSCLQRTFYGEQFYTTGINVLVFFLYIAQLYILFAMKCK